MDGDGGRFDEHPLIEGHTGNVVKGGTFADDHMAGEISVEVDIVIGKESVNAAVFAEVGFGRGIFTGRALAAGDDTGNDFVTDGDGFTGGVGFDIFTDFDDFAAALMSEDDRTEVEWITFVFVTVGTAYAAALNFDEDLIVIDFGDGEFAEFKFTGFDEVRQFCHFSHDKKSLYFLGW
jgi:hypothetical protein